MKCRVLVAVVILALMSSTAVARSSYYPQTVRLGNCIIAPGTMQIKLVECAGEPIQKSRQGIDLNTGDLKEIWFYKSGGNNILIHLAAGKVTRVEVQRE